MYMLEKMNGWTGRLRNIVPGPKVEAVLYYANMHMDRELGLIGC